MKLSTTNIIITAIRRTALRLRDRHTTYLLCNMRDHARMCGCVYSDALHDVIDSAQWVITSRKTE